MQGHQHFCNRKVHQGCPCSAGSTHQMLSVKCRVHVNTISNAAGGDRIMSTGLMTRSRLRRGCHCHAVHSVLYVGSSQGRLDSANSATGVWWFLGSFATGKVFVHDLASASTKELQAFQNGGAVSSMQVDSHGYVWMGFKGGVVQVWDAQTRSCLCETLSTSGADVRCVDVTLCSVPSIHPTLVTALSHAN